MSLALLVILAAVAPSVCDDRNGDLGASLCWDAAYQSADKELNSIWPGVLAAARASDKGFSGTPKRDTPSAARDLIAAQRAWIAYRDAQCSAEADWAQGGSLENVLIGQCLTTETQRRIRQLKELKDNFEGA